MFIQPNQAEYLKKWMVQKLKPICDADHEVLSEYVMALLRHDQSENELRLLCLKQLEDFLKQDTKLFVTDLFDHLGTYGAFNGSYQPPEINLSASVLLRKRSLAPDEPYLLTNNTPPLNPLDNQGRGSQSSTAPIPQYTPTQSHPSFLHFPEPPQSDLNLNPLPNFPPSQIHPYPSISLNQPRCSKRPRKSICRDYHYRGYCARGSNCQFSHDQRDQDSSSSSTYFSKTPSGEAEPSTQPPLGNCIPVVFTTPSLGQEIPGLGLPLPILPAPSFSPNRLEQSVIDQSSNNYNSSLRHPERFSRFEGSPSTPKKSSTTLIIENIPQSSLSDRAVREYFSIFGPLTSVSVDVYNAQAQVTFKSYQDAKQAYTSPEPVFNNRFVRIHFKRFPGNGPRRSHGTLQAGVSPAAAEGFGHHESNNEMNSNGYHHKPVDGSNTFKSPPVTDPPQQKEDVQVLSQREQELRLKIDAQKRLLEQLSQKKAAKSYGTTSHDSDMKSPSLIAQEAENQPQEACSQTESHLADPNESTADSINPTLSKPQLVAPKEALLSSPSGPTLFPNRSSSTTMTTNSSSVYVASRGGRKLTNSRTSWTPAGAAPTKAFRLDNRSCTLAVLHLPSSDAREKLKVYFEQFGPIVAVTPLSEDENVFDVSVKFGSRAAAEKALANGLEIPSVGKVAMRWVPIPAGSTGSSGSPRPQPFIPGLRSAHLPHYPGSFSLVNHHPSPANPPPLHNDSTHKNLGQHQAPPPAAANHDQLLNHHIDLDLVDDFCIDDEGDGCWKR